MMKKLLPILCFIALSLFSGARGGDVIDELLDALPVELGFKLGFKVRVVPDRNDHSRQLGLVVAPNKIRTDKARTLSVSGTITNFSDVPYANIDMRIAVTSYVGIGTDRAIAVVEPNRLPPGGTANFITHVSLSNEKPRSVKYTITAAAPPRPEPLPETQ